MLFFHTANAPGFAPGSHGRRHSLPLPALVARWRSCAWAVFRDSFRQSAFRDSHSAIRSYGWTIFRDNFLRPTPYLRVARKPDPAQWSDRDLTAVWVGHSTVLLNFCGTTILTDPVLTERMGPPHLWRGLNLGLRRITELPLRFQDLPPIDLVLLSHAHHDHWDMASLKYFTPPTEAVVPRGNSDLLPHGRFGRTTELHWGQRHRIGQITLTAIPVEHWGYRWGSEDKYRGYNGYLLEGHGKRVFFGGDTAFRDRLTGQSVDWVGRLGHRPIDLCILPIGACYYRRNHMTPEEAWDLFHQAQGRWMMPIHWRTFILVPLDKEPIWSPLQRLHTAAGPDAHRIVAQEPGEPFILR